ncbi:hypothetical protein B0H15DRAFT_839886 [Mycena belliarum]|uniref:Uncharacterized protein n=1 Tax=Mycena belliarum TaxID=1033014 RepID=A0AAD6U3C9_9AGAR|nr:hypothetical protein B0H15DRAFT_839886 [Mycena belliae]
MDDTEIPDAGSANDPDESDPQFSSSRQNFPLSPIDQQWLSLYILTQRDRPICSLQAMKEFLDMPDDLATAARIEELNEQYEEDLERLYMAQAEEYMDEAEDRYYSYQEASQSGQLEEAYANWRKEDGDRQLMWRHATELTHHAYQSRLSKLSETPPTNSDFPQSIDEYRLKPKETQHRIARFLLLETEDQRDKMLTEFGWAWRQVTPLKDEFQANIEFQEELRVSMAELQHVADPRKR